MKRFAFLALADISLLLFVLTICLWIGSTNHDELLGYRKGSRICCAHLYRTELIVHAGQFMPHYTDELYDGWQFRDYGLMTGWGGKDSPSFSFLEFRIVDEKWGRPGGTMADLRYVAIPFWMIAVLASILPALRVSLWIHGRRTKRSAATICAKCGYDLRASLDRCPECGEKIPPAKRR